MTADHDGWHGQSEDVGTFRLSQSTAVGDHILPTELVPGPLSRSGPPAGGG